MTARTESPACNCGQRSSFSIQIRTGTRCTTLVNSPDTTLRGIRANWAPVDLLIQTTRPRKGRGKASTWRVTGFPGETPGRRVSSRLAVAYINSGLYMLSTGLPAEAKSPRCR